MEKQDILKCANNALMSVIGGLVTTEIKENFLDNEFKVITKEDLPRLSEKFNEKLSEEIDKFVLAISVSAVQKIG